MTKLMTLIAVEVQMCGRWGVGGVATNESQVRLPIVRDPRTQLPWVPGASIAGSLRHHLREDAELWLGKAPGEYERVTGDIERVPSRLAVLGSIIGETSIDEVTSTAVDPARGAVAGRTLRQGELARPTSVTLAFEHTGSHDEDLLRRLAKWQPIFGRGRSSGLGRGVVEQVRVVTADLSTVEGLGWWLANRTGWFASGRAPVALVPRAPLTGSALAATPFMKEFIVTEPMHVGSGSLVRFDGRDHLDVLRMGTSAVVPGSSWKGLFRHRCQVILTAVATSATTSVTEVNQIMSWLFGSLETGRGELTFGDTIIEQPRFIYQTHVSIDRFTGGAMKGALYSTCALDRDNSLQLRIHWETGQFPIAVQGLLEHVMWDLHDGLISMGGMGSRGYGWVQFSDGSRERPGPVKLDVLAAEIPATRVERQ